VGDDGKPEDKAATSGRSKWWRGLLTVPKLVAATALTALVTWGVTELVTSVKEQAVSRNPIAWNVETNPAQVGAFSDLSIKMMLPAGAHPADGPGTGCNTFRPWAVAHGAIDAGATHLQVVLQGREPGQLLISDARAVVVARKAPTRGIGIGCPSAASAEFRWLTINLDSPGRRAHYQSARPFGFTLGQGETETFLVTATASTGIYDWYLEISVITGQTSRTIRIDDHGRPFRTGPSIHGQTWDWNYKDAWIGGVGGSVVPVGGKLY
jgi:hypothetical protein